MKEETQNKISTAENKGTKIKQKCFEEKEQKKS